MTFIKDIQNKIFLGKLRFLNIKESEDTDLKNLSLDSKGYLVLGEGGGSGTSSVETVTGDLVNNTDPKNPVVRMPTINWSIIAQKPTTFAPIVGSASNQAAAGDHTHAFATETMGGFMTGGDKAKLNAIADSATANSPATVAPLANGAAAIGTSLLYARQDHVHPLQASVATLTTGRTIALTGGATGTSASFNGSANASIAVTLAVPTAAIRGGVLKQTNIVDSAAAPTMEEFNSLLAVIRAAGIM